MTRRTTKGSEFNGKLINTGRKCNLDCDEKILKKIEAVFEHFQENNDRALVVRYDLRYPREMANPPEDNDAFRNTHRKFIKHFKQKGADPHYVAVKEHSNDSDSNKHHYHGLVLLNERKINSVDAVIAKADQFWAAELGVEAKYTEDGKRIPTGLVDDCTRDKFGRPVENGVVVKKQNGDDERYKNELVDRCFYRASYLAKTSQKPDDLKGKRELFCTQLGRKKKRKHE